MADKCIDALTGTHNDRHSISALVCMPKKIPGVTDFNFYIPDPCFCSPAFTYYFERKIFWLFYAGGALILLGIIVTNTFSARSSAKRAVSSAGQSAAFTRRGHWFKSVSPTIK